jgi:hypothetical protein
MNLGTCILGFTQNFIMDLLVVNAFASKILVSVDFYFRCNLTSVLLQLLAMGIHDLVNFDFMDRPSTEAINNAIDQLVLLEAVEKQDILKVSNVNQ